MPLSSSLLTVALLHLLVSPYCTDVAACFSYKQCYTYYNSLVKLPQVLHIVINHQVQKIIISEVV